MKTLFPLTAVALFSTSVIAAPTIVTEDNFAQAYTNMRLGAVVEKAGGINTFFEMPVPSSVPEEQFRCTNESRHFLFCFCHRYVE